MAADLRSNPLQNIISVAMVNKPIQYFKDTDASFKITCTFTGNETPTSAEWTHKTQAITSGQGGYTFDYVSGNKQSTLTKTSPTRTTDDGDYQCKFKMATETSHEPTSKSAVTVVRKSLFSKLKACIVLNDNLILTKISVDRPLYFLTHRRYKFPTT